MFLNYNVLQARWKRTEKREELRRDKVQSREKQQNDGRKKVCILYTNTPSFCCDITNTIWILMSTRVSVVFMSV